MEQDLLRVAMTPAPEPGRQRPRSPARAPEPSFGAQIAAFYPYPQPVIDPGTKPAGPDPRQRATQVSASSGIGKRRQRDD